MSPLASTLIAVVLCAGPLVAQIKVSGSLATGITGDVTASQISPDSLRVVYRADQELDEVFRLYSVPIGGGAALELGPPPVAGGDVQDFRISPDSKRVVYRADQDQDEVYELYSAVLVGRQPATQLNGPLVSGGDVASFEIAGDRVVYLANQESAARTELFSVPLSGGPAVRLNDALAAGGNVSRFEISPDGKRVVYLADQQTDEVFELFGVPIEGGAPVALGKPLDWARSFVITPDSRRVVYRAEALYSVSILGGPSSVLTSYPHTPRYLVTPDSRRVLFLAPGDTWRVQLHSVLIGGGLSKKLTEHGSARVDSFVISPDSRRAAYSIESGDSVHSIFTVPVRGGDVAPIVDGVNECGPSGFSPDSTRLLYRVLLDAHGDGPLLYSVPAAGGTSIRLTDRFVYGGLITPDSESVVCADPGYDADYHETGINLYSVPLAGGTTVRLNDALVSGGNVDGANLSPDGSRVVYGADQDFDEVFELYSVPLHGGPARKLNPPLVAGGTTGDVDRYVVSPDGTRLVYLADQDADQVFELYSVPVHGGRPTRLNGALVHNGDVDTFSWTVSPDSRRVVYLGDQEVDGMPDVYSVPIDGGPAVKLSPHSGMGSELDVSPDSSWVVFRDAQTNFSPPAIYAVPIDGGAPVELTGALPSGIVYDVQISSDSSRVVIMFDQGGDPFRSEVYSVPILGGIPTKLTPTPVVNGGLISAPQILADGRTVLYAGDFEADDVFESYSVPIEGGPSTKLNGPLVAGGDVVGSAPPVGSSHHVYLADQGADGVVELYSVSLPGLVRTKLNPPLVAGGDVSEALIAPDASRVVYRADQNANDVFELFSVPIGGGPATRLNAPLVAGGDVPSFGGFQVSPASERVVYFADQDTNDVLELYSVPIGGGPAAKLNVSGGDVQRSFDSLQFTSDGRRVLFVADHYADDVFELFLAPLLGGAPPERMSAPLVTNGDVTGGPYHSPFRVAGAFVIYRADQELDETFELYASRLVSTSGSTRPR